MGNSRSNPLAPGDKSYALRVTSGSDEGRMFPLVEGLLGSKDTLDYCLTDPEVDNLHARISLRRGFWYITDLTSAPDIKVNNVTIKSRRIVVGDTVTIGSTILQVVNASADLKSNRSGIPTISAPASHEDELPSDAAQIATENNVDAGTPAKPDSKNKTSKKESVTPAETAAYSNRGRSDSSQVPSSEGGVAVNSEALNKYRSADAKQNTKRMKSNVGLLFFMIFIGIVAAILLGGMVMAKKKQARLQLYAAYSQAETFEKNNPGIHDKIISKYQEVAQLADHIDQNIAIMARRQVQRIRTTSKRHAERLKSTLETLDSRSEELAEQNKFSQALDVYENYQGTLRDEIFSAREDQISSLRALLAKQLESQPPVAEESDSTAEARKEEAEKEARIAGARESAAKVKRINTVAIQHILTGNTAAAIKEISSILEDESLSSYHNKAEHALTSLRTLATVERTEKISASRQDESFDPAEDPGQPALIRLIYSLRKGDLLAAQVLVRKLRGTLLYGELYAKAKMSAAELRREQAVMAGFAQLLSSFTKSSIKTIPRPEKCVAILQELKTAGNEKQYGDFCKSLSKLKDKYPKSLFIVRYSDVFDLSSPSRATVVKKPAKLHSTGNAKITGVDARTYLFDSVDPLPDPTKGKAGLYGVKDVFFDPGTSNSVGARLELHTMLPYKKLNERQGSFEIPIIFNYKRPDVGDSLYVGTDLELGTKLISESLNISDNTIYTENFAQTRGTKWKCYGTGLSFRDGVFPADLSRESCNPPAGTPNLWFNSELKDPTIIEIDLVRENNADLVLKLGCLEFVLAGSSNRHTGVWIDGHLVKRQQIPPLPLKKPFRITALWSPSTSSVKVRNETLTGTVDATRKISGPVTVGFISRGKFTFHGFKLSRPALNAAPGILGVNRTKTSVLLANGSGEKWKALRKGQEMFLLNENKKGENEHPPQVKSIPASITHVQDGLIICRIAESPGFVKLSTVASLSPSSDAGEASESQATQILESSGWNPQAVYARMTKTSDGKTVLVPDMPCSYTPLGFIAKTERTLLHPNSGEPFALFPGESIPARFSERAGMFESRILNAITESGENDQCFLLSGKAAVPGAFVAITPISFAIDSRESDEGWLIHSGSWGSRLNRLLSPLDSDTLAVACSRSALWENCQYTVNVQIEKPSSGKDRPELIAELFSPLWRKSLALTTGTKATAIEFDKVSGYSKKTELNSKTDPPLKNLEPKWSGDFKTTPPILKQGKRYVLKIRRAGHDFAFYVNGKRLAVVNYPGLNGDLYLRIASAGGQISLGPAVGTILSRSVRIPATEPELGEFGYVLSVAGAHVLVDADAHKLVKGGSISIMKVDNTAGSANSSAFSLKRVATGTITDLSARMARALIVVRNEPITPGMKVMAGMQPAVLDISSEQLASLERGF